MRASSSLRQAARNVVFVDGTRIPFSSSGTVYSKLMAVELAQLAITGIYQKLKFPPKDIDYLTYGQVSQEIRTSNIAREAANLAGIPVTVPGHTVTMACIGANQAITTGAEKIITGQASIVLAGGVETFSDVPIRLARNMRLGLLAFNRQKKAGLLDTIKAANKHFHLKDFGIETPAIRNFTTNEVMGNSSDRLAQRFGVSRADQDLFAYNSHIRAAKAHADGLYKDEITPYNGSIQENLIKGDTTLEKLAKLKPSFRKQEIGGTHTAGSSSPLTDGASACFIMAEETCKQRGYTPKTYIRAWNYTAMDPFDDLLLGPSYSINRVLQQSGLKLSDIDVFEIHEAFAGQVLSNVVALNSDSFCKDAFGRTERIGEIDLKKLNAHGGSLSIGHPFSATGVRLVLTASNRLHRENGRFAVVAACADGGLGHACLLERYPA